MNDNKPLIVNHQQEQSNGILTVTTRTAHMRHVQVERSTSPNGNPVITQKTYEVHQSQTNYSSNTRTILVAAIAIIVLAAIVFFIVNSRNEPKATQPLTFDATIPQGTFTNDGFIFPNSDKIFLTREQLGILHEKSAQSQSSGTPYSYRQLLRFSINEIYARKGFQFIQGGEYDLFYSQYDWYNHLEKREAPDSLFNQYEKANVDLLVTIERENGFR